VANKVEERLLLYVRRLLIGLAIGIGLSPGTAFLYPLVVGRSLIAAVADHHLRLTMWLTVSLPSRGSYT
jgi:hypothetical protein